MTTKNTKRYKKHYLTKKSRIIIALGGKCSICGYNKNIAALHFHHKNPETKERNKEWLLNDGNQQKLVLVCANCHYEIHHPQCEKSCVEERLDSYKKRVTCEDLKKEVDEYNRDLAGEQLR